MSLKPPPPVGQKPPPSLVVVSRGEGETPTESVQGTNPPTRSDFEQVLGGGNPLDGPVEAHTREGTVRYVAETCRLPASGVNAVCRLVRDSILKGVTDLSQLPPSDLTKLAELGSLETALLEKTKPHPPTKSGA